MVEIAEDLKTLQECIHQWSLRNFGEQPPAHQLLGAMEELGELAHAHLKEQQGIRMDEDHVANAKDAVGDLFIYLCDYCARRGWDIEGIICDTWDQVSKRDWRGGDG
jgi:NTP pyrophosphatase (non-canonical NTP hydrolase)